RGERPNTGSIAPISSSTKEPFANARVTRETLDRFSVWVSNDKGEEARFVFYRYGIRWKLTGIVIPLTDVSPGNLPSTPNTPSKAFSPREAALSTVTITKFHWYKSGSDNMLTLTIENFGQQPVKDIEITCPYPLGAKSDTDIYTYRKTIYETVPAGKTRTIRDINMGFVHPKVVGDLCKITDLAVADTHPESRLYQVTGSVWGMTNDVITVKKDNYNEKWEVGQNKETKVNGRLTIGSRVTIRYKLLATSIDLKGARMDTPSS